MNKSILIILASLLVLGGCGGGTSKHAGESDGEHAPAAADFEASRLNSTCTRTAATNLYPPVR